MTTLLIAGVSVRAFAESAVAAGFAVVAIDAYGDLDLRAVAETRPVAGRYTAAAAARGARAVECDAVAYTSNFENHPRAVATLATGRTLWGNPPAVLARARDPFELARILGAPDTLARAPTRGGRWLRKPRRSGGGHGIVPWRSGMRVPRQCVVQAYVSGVPGSIVFAADRQAIVPLALTRQIIGDPAFGASGFQYAGSILARPEGPVYDRAVALATTATRAFGLVGVNGIDFVVRRGVPIPIEINPRYTAAMELAERHYGLSIAAAHVAACTGTLGVDPAAGAPVSVADASGTLVDVARARGTLGKAIVYARHAVTLGRTEPWLDDPSVRDISPSGTRIPAGAPICTVLAAGRDVVDCHHRLAARAAGIYAAVATRRAAA